MAEFNASAFSAVESFFVIDKQGASNVEAKMEPADNQRRGNARRLGVGAAAKPIKPSLAPTHLMKIGNKKRNHEEDEAEVFPDTDDEEDLGRTGIVSDLAERKDPVEVNSSSTRKQKKAKKKSGKKEREQLMREKELAIQESSSELVSGAPSGTQIALVGDTVNNDNQQVQDSTAKVKESSDNSKGDLSREKQKRKRRKVRSRQKNIYKDNRPADKKPDHLVPGGYEYKGRPITAETRAKLNKKEGGTNGSNSSTKENMSSHWLDDNDEEGDNGVPIFKANVAKSLEVSVVKDDDSHSDGARNQGAPSKKKKTKQKKPKYKNIQ